MMIPASTLRISDTLLEMLSRESTNPYEAASAGRKLANIFNRYGLKTSIAIPAGFSTISLHDIYEKETSKLRAENLKLKTEIQEEKDGSREITAQRDALRGRLAALEAESRDLRAAAAYRDASQINPCSDPESPLANGEIMVDARSSDDGLADAKVTADNVGTGGVKSCTERDFAAEAAKIAGSRHWLSALAAAARVSVVRLRRVITSNEIPRRIWELLDTMTPADWAPAPRRRWTDDDRSILRTIATGLLDDVTLARMLTRRFGRCIREYGVARQRRRLGIPACRWR